MEKSHLVKKQKMVRYGPFKFEFDIIDNNSVPREEFGEDWINLIGDILVNIMDEEYGKSDNRENDTI